MRILHVEDNENDILLIRRVLERGGIPITMEVVMSGDEAAKQLDKVAAGKDNERAPDLVLLDIKLPNISGLELLGRIRSKKRLRGVPVVMFSSSSEARDVDAARKLGANAYMVKPLDPAALQTFLELLYADFERSKVPHFWPDVSLGSANVV